MRQLKQQGTAGPEKDGGFSVDPPGLRGRAKKALDRSCRPDPDRIKRKGQIVFGNQIGRLIRAACTKLSQSTWNGHYSWRTQRTGLPARCSTGNQLRVPKLVMA